MLLKAIEFKKPYPSSEYPFSLPWMRTIENIEFPSPVTIIWGENGSGKSTLLSMMADALNLYRIQDYHHPEESLSLPDNPIKTIATLSKPTGFFFEAEAFITYLHFMKQEKVASQLELAKIEKAYAHKSVFAKQQAASVYQRTLSEIDGLYANDLSMRSHGESYLDFFASRLRPQQLILLDEPETPLSFQSQLTLLSMMKTAVNDHCQFIIATHSPVLLAFPNATIYELSKEGLKLRTYEELDGIQLLKQFLNNPEQFIRQL
jgi:predicted ATPase